MRDSVAAKFGVFALALWAGLWLFWATFQSAVMATLNWLLVGKLGVIPISLEISLPLLTTAWAPPLILAVLIGGPVWIVFLLGRGRREDVSDLEEARWQMVRLRKVGVAIGKQGRELARTELESWIGQVREWQRNVIEAIEIYSLGDAEWFAELDRVPAPRVAAKVAAPEHQTHYREHDYRLVRLEELLEEYDA